MNAMPALLPGRLHWLVHWHCSCRTRAQERVDMAQRDLARYGKSKGLEQILDKMIQALDRVDADCKAAEAEYVKSSFDRDCAAFHSGGRSI